MDLYEKKYLKYKKKYLEFKKLHGGSSWSRRCTDCTEELISKKEDCYFVKNKNIPDMVNNLDWTKCSDPDMKLSNEKDKLLNYSKQITHTFLEDTIKAINNSSKARLDSLLDIFINERLISDIGACINLLRNYVIKDNSKVFVIRYSKGIENFHNLHSMIHILCNIINQSSDMSAFIILWSKTVSTHKDLGKIYHNTNTLDPRIWLCFSSKKHKDINSLMNIFKDFGRGFKTNLGFTKVTLFLTDGRISSPDKINHGQEKKRLRNKFSMHLIKGVDLNIIKTNSDNLIVNITNPVFDYRIILQYFINPRYIISRSIDNYALKFFIINNLAGDKKYIPYSEGNIPLDLIDNVDKLINHIIYIEPEMYSPGSMLSYNGHEINDADVVDLLRYRRGEHYIEENQIIILYRRP